MHKCIIGGDSCALEMTLKFRSVFLAENFTVKVTANMDKFLVGSDKWCYNYNGNLLI